MAWQSLLSKVNKCIGGDCSTGFPPYHVVHDAFTKAFKCGVCVCTVLPPPVQLTPVEFPASALARSEVTIAHRAPAPGVQCALLNVTGRTSPACIFVRFFARYLRHVFLLRS